MPLSFRKNQLKHNVECRADRGQVMTERMETNQRVEVRLVSYVKSTAEYRSV
jgi:hypothetical protein